MLYMAKSRNFFIIVSALLVATAAFAFGGGGRHRDRESAYYGVSSIGVHYGDTCPQGSSTTGQGGKTGIYNGGAMCKCTDADKVYTVNGCKVQPDICDDHTINQCGLGYYCQFNTYCCDDACREDGVCTKITGETEVIPVGDTTKTYLESGTTMDWWSAYSWCKGNNMNLVTGSIAGHRLNESYNYFDKTGDIYTYFGRKINFWTGYIVGVCDAWAVDVFRDAEFVNSLSRNYPEFVALCE